MFGEWKKHDWKLHDREVWGRSIWIDFSEWDKRQRCIPCERSPESLQQRRIVIIKWLGWPFLWIPASLFPQHLLQLPSRPMSKVTMVTEMEVMMGLSNMDFNSPRPAWPRPLLHTQSGEQHGVSSMAVLSRLLSQLLGGWWLITLDCFLLWISWMWQVACLFLLSKLCFCLWVSTL